MKNRTDSQVAVHGCIGDDPFEVTIFSDEFDEDNKFRIHNGKIEVIQSPFVNGSSESIDDSMDPEDNHMARLTPIRSNRKFPAQMM